MKLLVESRRPKSDLYQIPPRAPPGSRGGPLAGAHKTLALFTMLIGTHVKHKFMLKAKMLSSSRMRYGADRSCLPVPDDQAHIGPRGASRRTIMLISIFDVWSTASSSRLVSPFLFVARFFHHLPSLILTCEFQIRCLKS